MKSDDDKNISVIREMSSDNWRLFGKLFSIHFSISKHKKRWFEKIFKKIPWMNQLVTTFRLNSLLAVCREKL